ncbi:MAG: CpaF family protein, partial [Chloroflexi bacterium]
MPPVVEAAPPTPPPPVVKKPIKALSSSVRNGKAGSEPPSTFLLIKDKVQQELINDLKQNPSSLDLESGRQIIEPIFGRAVVSAGLVLSRTERQNLYDMIVADILGFGPLQPLLDDESISEIMVNGPYQIYIERGGKLVLSDVKFQDNAHVLRIIERILAPLGRRVDESSPMVDARLPDGSRVNAIIPPLAIDGPGITIRKFSKKPLTIEDLIRFGSFTEEFSKFIEACVISHLNIIVSGG